jgi:hypothetical protein
MRRVVLLLALAVAFAPAAASAWEVGAKGAYWIADLSGQVRLDENGTGTQVDFRDDLGVGNENFFFGEGWLSAGRHHLSLSGARIDYSGTSRISQPITFGGVRFNVTAQVDTGLEYTMLDLAYRYDLLDLENVLAGFSVGPMIQVKYLDGTVSMESLGQKESATFQVPIPMLGLGGHLGIVANLVEVRARVAGMVFRKDSIVEVQGEVSVNPMPFFELVAGYRHFTVDVEEGNLLLDYTQTGPYLGASVKI